MGCDVQNKTTNLKNQVEDNQSGYDEGAFLTEETIVEELSIDGICGVY